MKQDVSLVLSSGGARGMAHIGVIEELEKMGYNITSIAGSSIGALVGGIYAVGNLDDYTNWMRDLNKMDIFKLMDFAISKSGFIKGEKVFKEIKRFIGDKNIEDLPIPYAAIAADIINHKEVVFTSGNLMNAIRSSISIPTIFFPWEINNTFLVDGGMVNPLPLDKVKHSDNDLLVAVNLNAPIPYQRPVLNNDQKKIESRFQRTREKINKKWTSFVKNHKHKNKKPGFFDLFSGSLLMMQDRFSNIAVEKYKPDILVNISRSACDVLAFHRTNELIEAGRQAFHLSLKNHGNISRS